MEKGDTQDITEFGEVYAMDHETEEDTNCQRKFPEQEMVQDGESQWEGCSKCSQLYIPRAEQYVCDDCLPSWNLDVDRQAEVVSTSCLTRMSVSKPPNLMITATKANTGRAWIPPVMKGGRMSPPPACGAGQVYTQLQQAEGHVRHQKDEAEGQVRLQQVVKKGRVNNQPVQGKRQVYQRPVQGVGYARHKQVVTEGRVKYQQVQGDERLHQLAQGGGRVRHQQEEGEGQVRRKGDDPRHWDKRGGVVGLDECTAAPVPAKDSHAVGQGMTWAQVVQGQVRRPTRAKGT